MFTASQFRFKHVVNMTFISIMTIKLNNAPLLSVFFVGRWAVLLFLSEMFPFLSFVSVFAFLLFLPFSNSLLITLTVLQKSVSPVLSLHFNHLPFNRSGRFLCHMFFGGLQWRFYYTTDQSGSRRSEVLYYDPQKKSTLLYNSCANAVIL